MQLDQIVPWGRSLAEYQTMFGLNETLCGSGVLDCGGGPASFTAEMHQHGHRAVAIDPVYAFSDSAIESQFDAVADKILSQVSASPNDWVWKFHRSPEELRLARRKALELFLSDFESGRREGRYFVGALPTLPFRQNSFGLALCSHLLFLYSDLLSLEFHLQSVRELCRVAGEVRIFPLLTLSLQISPHLGPVLAAMAADGWEVEILPVEYELQRGGNQMLRLSR